MLIYTIALNTFRESIRDKILYTILLFQLGFAAISVYVSYWSMGQETKILLDFSITLMTIFGLIIAVFIGSGLIHKEIEKKTIYTILSKPISKDHFIIGKYFGLLLTLALCFVLMTAGVLVINKVFIGVINYLLILQALFIFFKMAIMLGFTLLFGSYSSPIVTIVFSLFVFVAGNFSSDIIVLPEASSISGLSDILKMLYYIVPNFELLDFQTEIVHNLEILPKKMYYGALYAVAYSGILIMLAKSVFKKVDLK